MCFVFVYTRTDKKPRRVRIYTPYVSTEVLTSSSLVSLFINLSSFLFNLQHIFLYECFERVKEEKGGTLQVQGAAATTTTTSPSRGNTSVEF